MNNNEFLVPISHFHPSLTFEIQALYTVPYRFKGMPLASPSGIRLGFKWLIVTNNVVLIEGKLLPEQEMFDQLETVCLGLKPQSLVLGSDIGNDIICKFCKLV